MADPVPRNVPGPFYVEDQCCLTCGVALEAAPHNIAFDDEQVHGGCYVRRQPSSATEVDDIIDAMQSTEVDCIRYRGDDPALRRRLESEGLGHFCDPANEAARSEQASVVAMAARRSRRSFTEVKRIDCEHQPLAVVIRRRDDGVFEFREIAEHVIGHQGRREFHKVWLPQMIVGDFASAEAAEIAARSQVEWLAQNYVPRPERSLVEESTELTAATQGRKIKRVARPDGLRVNIELSNGDRLYISGRDLVSTFFYRRSRR